MSNETKNIDRPILLTGAHRSGTTWLANMLALGGHVQIASEPYNLDSWAYKLNGLAKNWFTYAPGLDQREALSAFSKVLQCKTGRVYGRRMPQRYIPLLRKGRLLIKDPIACMSSEWLSQNFSLDVLVLIRHPAAFAASLKRMQWHFPFEHLIAQNQLMKDLLLPYRDEIIQEKRDIIEQSALIWNIIYYVLTIFIERNPDWTVVKHESLSRRPIVELHELYKKFNLLWSSDVEEKIMKFTGKDNPVEVKDGVAHQMMRDSEKNIKQWKNMLTNSEIDLVRKKTESIASKFYTESDW